MVDERTTYVDIALLDEPAWPDASGPYLFLLEVSGPLEERLLEAWIERNRPPDVDPGDVQIAVLPQTRRKRRRRQDPRLEAFLNMRDDPLLVPLRIVWLARAKDGKRTVGLRDLVTFGDPRDPDPIRQRAIFYFEPERARIVTGGTGRQSEVRAMWAAPGGPAETDGRSLTEYTAMQAWLTLERSERELRGSRYKVPKFPRESLTERTAFSTGVATLARTSGESYEAVAKKAQRYVKEIAATHSPYVIDLVTGGVRWLLNKAYVGVYYDEQELETLYSMSQQFPLVFLPSHRSNMDHLVLQYVLYENGLPPNHTAGGINMNFFPIGPFLRRSGVFFIRREFKDNLPYKFVLRQYLDYLLQRRFPLEWFIEGGRSRSGKMRAPRYGMLAYVVESFQRGSAEDVIIIPVSIGYDQIQDVESYAAEQSGGGKDKESIGWLIRAVRSVRKRFGAVHLRFGAPLSLRTYMADHRDELPADAETRSTAIPKLAFEISARINEATPITPISLVALVLLADEDRSLSVEETIDRLRPYLELIARRDLPMTEKLDPTNRVQVEAALHALVLHGVVSRFEGATETVYRIGANQYLAAAFYRNTIIHFFLNVAITEVALVAARAKGADDLQHAVIAEALALRDLLKFEFFFSSTQDFEVEIRFELRDHHPDWRALLEAGDVDAVLRSFDPFQSPAVLRPFVEAYQVVADLIDQAAFHSKIDQDKLRKDAMALGKQYLLQGRIKTAESVSSVLFDSAIQLAANRKLFTAGPDMVERRKAFAVEIRTLIGHLDSISAIAIGRGAGILD